VLVDNKGGSRYEIPTNYTEGIIVATGDVYVAGSFKGMILSGGTISFASNAEVKSDESMVQDLFTEDVQKALPQFVPYFKEGSSAASAAIGAIDVDSYVSYENWKKNE
jgi:hypothetical protein